jgi:poly(A) polymerase
MNVKNINIMDSERAKLETEFVIRMLKEKYNQFESAEEKEKREELLLKLNEIIQNWIQAIAEKKNISEEERRKSKGKVYTFGSYRLGVHGPSSDMDALCVAPKFVDRDLHFHKEFYEILKKRKDVKDILVIKDALVPHIKLKFMGISIDLLFARIDIPEGMKDDSLKYLAEEKLLLQCDTPTIISINGCKVNDKILELIPNAESFRITLRVIKLWAKQNGINSYVFGFLNGVSMAIMVANICIQNPKEFPSQLVKKFFNTYANWDWSKPVTICEINNDYSNKVETAWSPKSQHPFPVITPCIHSNCLHKVNDDTKSIILKFMVQADEILSKASESFDAWDLLFTPFDILHSYKQFLRVDIVTNNEKDFLNWRGFVESKLSFLLVGFAKSGILLHPFPKEYVMPIKEYRFGVTYFFGMKLKKDASLTIKNNTFDMRNVVEAFCNILIPKRFEFVAKNELKNLTPDTYNVRLLSLMRAEVMKEIGIDDEEPLSKKKKVE